MRNLNSGFLSVFPILLPCTSVENSISGLPSYSKLDCIYQAQFSRVSPHFYCTFLDTEINQLVRVCSIQPPAGMFSLYLTFSWKLLWFWRQHRWEYFTGSFLTNHLLRSFQLPQSPTLLYQLRQIHSLISIYTFQIFVHMVIIP